MNEWPLPGVMNMNVTYYQKKLIVRYRVWASSIRVAKKVHQKFQTDYSLFIECRSGISDL